MRILITGKTQLVSSNRVDEEFIKFKNLYPNTEKFVILSFGGRNGVEVSARVISKRYNLEYLEFEADFKRYGPDAKSIRNTEALKKGKPNLIWIFHINMISLKKVKGLDDLVSKAKRRCIPVKLIEV